MDGVLRITRIHLAYRLRIPPGSRERVEALLGSYAKGCPAYQSIKGCIDCDWEAELTEDPSLAT